MYPNSPPGCTVISDNDSFISSLHAKLLNSEGRLWSNHVNEVVTGNLN